MVQKKGRRTWITALAVLLILLAVIGTIALIRGLNSGKADPYAQNGDSSSTNSSDNDTQKQETNTDTQKDTDTKKDDSGSEPALDPSTVSTIDIAPMEITVSYVKGTGGFQYEVLRTSNGTRYVEFRSADLVGTKCTNDVGTFASILANPTDTESATLTKTTTVDGVKYGLSLEGSTCTSNQEKLQAYQKSFSDAFSLLKKMN